MGNLHVEVLDDEIIVTVPYTHYTVTYYSYKQGASQAMTIHTLARPTRSSSLKPGRPASDKARELGCIV